MTELGQRKTKVKNTPSSLVPTPHLSKAYSTEPVSFIVPTPDVDKASFTDLVYNPYDESYY